jgi:hypothetical protein
MKERPGALALVLLSLLLTRASAQQPAAPQTFTGRLSDSMCGASHQAHGGAGAMSDRDCLFACIKGLAKYVLVDQNNQVIPISNQDAMGIPLYAGRPVKLTGEKRGDAIFVTKVEAIPAHLHLGHVMTNWRDTPGTRGFLPVAIDEARVAVLHAKLAAKGASLDEVKLHAGHVLNALDPSVEPKGPGAGYGVKKAATGAQQHLDFSVKAEGATANVTSHAAQVSDLLARALQSVDQGAALVQRIRASTDATEAGRLASDLSALVQKLNDEELQPAKTQMDQILKDEGILGAPR